MTPSRLAIAFAALLISAPLQAQDKGSLEPRTLPPLAKPDDPATPAKELFGRKTTPSQQKPQVVGFYAKGCLAHCHDIIQAATELGKPVVVDPKGANFTKYRGATLVTPNLSEFAAVAGQIKSDFGGDLRGGLGADFWGKVCKRFAVDV